ncbi:bifunctional riboflavin kinase/FAD synthetase [Clostridium sp. MB40-C1]|uniref:bifunctional riboflavin kinase/FAD synthetase n=1 Tax=Clostridium sp. MB40-C1 TaxID=3070996 RepID=UPI0027E196AB|nr:bifunctional riboflavin kinase/FAD synthetase [Clostridium sp. MB40-C1]WMJ82019.1 bifunctional riboflavin kinase/FAD synthetase [Clostridium sp. MB40-C1]
MIIYEDNFSLRLKEKTYLALGSFDGLHLGHMSLINKTINLAKKNKCKSMVFTFKNHPLTIINEEIAPKLIINNEIKSKLLKDIGIDIVNYANFDEEFMKITPEEYVEKLINCYNVQGVVVGFNNRFGYKNLGDVDLLRELGDRLGFEVYVIDPVKENDEIISSSSIRHLISEGDIEKANRYLTRAFMLEGKVIRGNQVGRKMNFPTVNLDYDKKFVLPRGGVYYTVVEYNGIPYKGITNVGYNPTVKNKKLSIETHMLEFNKEIYGQDIKVFFLKRIRDEKRFNSLEELSAQIKKDKNYAKDQKNILHFVTYLL